MKLMFIHGGTRVKQDENGIFYTDTNFTNEVWDRYAKVCDKLHVLLRIEPKIYCHKIAKESFNHFDTSKLEYIDMPDIYRPRWKYLSLSNRNIVLDKIETTVKKCDKVIIRSAINFYTVNTVKAAIKYNKPYLIEVTGCPFDAYWNYDLVGKFVAPLQFLITRIIVKNAPNAVYVTEHFLQNRYPCDGRTLSCSNVSLPEIHTNIFTRRVKKIQEASPPYILGTLASLTVPPKWQKGVIKALYLLKKKGIIFHYRIAGTGSPEYLQAVAKKYDVLDQVHFSGSLPHNEVFTWLDDIDIYIQPSKQEGLPRALVEAMSRACPAIGSTAGGISELIDQKYVFRKGSVKGICNILSSYTKEDMYSAAKQNFETAKKYEKTQLEAKRNEFLSEFMKH